MELFCNSKNGEEERKVVQHEEEKNKHGSRHSRQGGIIKKSHEVNLVQSKTAKVGAVES